MITWYTCTIKSAFIHYLLGNHPTFAIQNPKIQTERVTVFSRAFVELVLLPIKGSRHRRESFHGGCRTIYTVGKPKKSVFSRERLHHFQVVAVPTSVKSTNDRSAQQAIVAADSSRQDECFNSTKFTIITMKFNGGISFLYNHNSP